MRKNVHPFCPVYLHSSSRHWFYSCGCFLLCLQPSPAVSVGRDVLPCLRPSPAAATRCDCCRCSCACLHAPTACRRACGGVESGSDSLSREKDILFWELANTVFWWKKLENSRRWSPREKQERLNNLVSDIRILEFRRCFVAKRVVNCHDLTHHLVNPVCDIPAEKAK